MCEDMGKGKRASTDNQTGRRNGTSEGKGKVEGKFNGSG